MTIYSTQFGSDDFALPWELFELYRICNGIHLKRGVFPVSVNFFKLQTILDHESWRMDTNHFKGMHFTNSVGCTMREISLPLEPTVKWLTIGEEAEYNKFMLCCDKSHPDYGSVSNIISNCSEGDAVAHSLLDLFKGLYIK